MNTITPCVLCVSIYKNGMYRRRVLAMNDTASCLAFFEGRRELEMRRPHLPSPLRRWPFENVGLGGRCETSRPDILIVPHMRYRSDNWASRGTSTSSLSDPSHWTSDTNIYKAPTLDPNWPYAQCRVHGRLFHSTGAPAAFPVQCNVTHLDAMSLACQPTNLLSTPWKL